MKKALFFCFVLSTCNAWAQQEDNKAISDLALIAGNVKYYYPTKHAKPWQWNKLNAYILSGWQKDSVTLTAPANLYEDIQQKYEDAGIRISLYKTKPVANITTALLLRGKHWEYKGYGDSKNKFLIGPIAWVYNWFINPYGKKLKRNDATYIERLSKSGNFSYTNEEILVKLHDSLWLGMPIKPKHIAPTAAYKSFTENTDKRSINYRLTYYLDIWSSLYHFSNDKSNKETWLHRLEMGIDNIVNEEHLYARIEQLNAIINDAHTNFYNPRMLSGRFYKIDGKFYYNDPSADSTKPNTWQVIRYNSIAMQEAYNAMLERMSSPTANGKNYLALRAMASPDDTAGVQLLLKQLNSGDTFSVQLKSRYDKLDPGWEYKHSEGRVNDKGIYFADIKRGGSNKAIAMLKDENCKALIIDMRSHISASQKLLGLLLDSNLHHYNMLVPVRSYADNNFVRYDTIKQTIRRAKNTILKPIVVLCDESDLSSPETSLMAFEQCPNVTIMGRATQGTTGNSVVAPIYTNGKLADFHLFTPGIITYASGKRFKGIEPDIIVNKTLNDLLGNNDELYNAAVGYLSK